MRTVLRRGAVVWAVLALLALAAAPLAAQNPPAQGGELFVQRGSSGTLVPIPGKPGVFNLTLRVPEAVVAFTDRPARRVRNESLASFAARWQRRGFADDPPNAALVIDDAPASRDVIVLELLSRRLLGSGVIRYRVRALTATGPRSPLVRLARGADRRVQRSFGRASLYVDPSTGGRAMVTLSVPALTEGQRVALSFDRPTQVEMTITEPDGATVLVTDTNTYVFGARGGVPATSPTLSLFDVGTSITGTAQLSAGVTVWALVTSSEVTGPPQTISNGPFRLPVPQ